MSKNPFDYPEIRSQLALYVSIEDALSCVQVSKAFSQDFAYPIWHTIDFDSHDTFCQLDEAILRKYGHHIRVVEGISKQEHLDSLRSLGASKISRLNFMAEMDNLFLAYCNDIIRRNQATLTDLEIHNEYHKEHPVFMIFDSLTSMMNPPQSSMLTEFTIRQLTLTRDSFTSALRCCQSLITVDLWNSILLPSRNFDDYQHPGVKLLRATVVQTFEDRNPPLLVHFPNLETWDTEYISEPSTFPTQAVKDGVSRWCPKLEAIQTNATPSSLLTHLLVNVFTNLSALHFDYGYISPELILALLYYPNNWTEITTYLPEDDYFDQFEEDGVPDVEDEFGDFGWMFQSVLRVCRNLRKFSFPQHEMDMDAVEQVPWACKDMSCLTVRIKGLDTRDKIEGAIALWREGRKQEKRNTEIQVLEDEEMVDANVIEARTAKHLLQFDKLDYVWLGSKLWEL